MKVQVYIPDELVEKVKKEAEKQYCSMSDIFRMAIVKMLLAPPEPTRELIVEKIPDVTEPEPIPKSLDEFRVERKITPKCTGITSPCKFPAIGKYKVTFIDQEGERIVTKFFCEDHLNAARKGINSTVVEEEVYE